MTDCNLIRKGLMLSSFLIASASSSSIHGNHIRRGLQEDEDKVTKTEWPECIGKTMRECAGLVRRDARNHEIDNLVVKVVVPRTKEEIQQTYMKVGIAINIFNKVTGDKNDGMITYPFVWVSSTPGNTRELGPWDCSGDMSAWDCCQKIKEDVPDMDIHGNHIQCFAHLNDLVPDIDPDSPQVYHDENLHYMTFVYDELNSKYTKRIFTPEELVKIEEDRAARASGELGTLDDMLNGSPSLTVEELLTLEADLMEGTAAMGDAQNLLGDLENALEVATDDGNLASLSEEELNTSLSVEEGTQVGDILRAVRHKIYDYTSTGFVMDKYIWIYASHNGKVWRAPQVGGTFDGHEEALIDMPGYEDFKLRYTSSKVGTTDGTRARYLKWNEVNV